MAFFKKSRHFKQFWKLQQFKKTKRIFDWRLKLAILMKSTIKGHYSTALRNDIATTALSKGMVKTLQRSNYGFSVTKEHLKRHFYKVRPLKPKKKGKRHYRGRRGKSIPTLYKIKRRFQKTVRARVRRWLIATGVTYNARKVLHLLNLNQGRLTRVFSAISKQYRISSAVGLQAWIVLNALDSVPSFLKMYRSYGHYKGWTKSFGLKKQIAFEGRQAKRMARSTSYRITSKHKLFRKMHPLVHLKMEPRNRVRIVKFRHPKVARCISLVRRRRNVHLWKRWTFKRVWGRWGSKYWNRFKYNDRAVSRVHKMQAHAADRGWRRRLWKQFRWFKGVLKFNPNKLSELDILHVYKRTSRKLRWLTRVGLTQKGQKYIITRGWASKRLIKFHRASAPKKWWEEKRWQKRLQRHAVREAKRLQFINRKKKKSRRRRVRVKIQMLHNLVLQGVPGFSRKAFIRWATVKWGRKQVKARAFKYYKSSKVVVAPQKRRIARFWFPWYSKKGLVFNFKTRGLLKWSGLVHRLRLTHGYKVIGGKPTPWKTGFHYVKVRPALRTTLLSVKSLRLLHYKQQVYQHLPLLSVAGLIHHDTISKHPAFFSLKKAAQVLDFNRFFKVNKITTHNIQSVATDLYMQYINNITEADEGTSAIIITNTREKTRTARILRTYFLLWKTFFQGVYNKKMVKSIPPASAMHWIREYLRLTSDTEGRTWLGNRVNKVKFRFKPQAKDDEMYGRKKKILFKAKILFDRLFIWIYSQKNARYALAAPIQKGIVQDYIIRNQFIFKKKFKVRV